MGTRECEINFGLVHVDNNLSCAKRIIDDCAKGAETFLKFKLGNRLKACWVTTDLNSSWTILTIKLIYYPSDGTENRDVRSLMLECSSYCCGIKAGILGILGAEKVGPAREKSEHWDG